MWKNHPMTQRNFIALVTGGARSGKSAQAENLARAQANLHDLPLIYIATAEPRDGEMEDRIRLHQDRRGAGWVTVEEPKDLAGALRRTDGQGVRLVDCLTLWLANAFEDADVADLCATLSQQADPVILVTNELGMGIVPADAATRRFRDQHGWMNQAVAGIADEVWMAVCGLPLRLKPERNDS